MGKKRAAVGVVIKPSTHAPKKVKKAEPEEKSEKSGIENPFTTGDLTPDFDMLAWMLYPMTPKEFFADYWEKKPLHVKRQAPHYYDGLFKKEDVMKHIRAGQIVYEKNLNLAKAIDGVKTMFNQEGVADEAYVNKQFAKGVSMQVMHPQQFHEPVTQFMSGLESKTGSLWGANSYITPAKSQGFAPHYDDVEVFMIQTEGSKRWRLYSTEGLDGCPLPRTYGPDFTEEELSEPIFDDVLSCGDLLYFPRGTIHVGVAQDTYSHHLTVSAYQNNSWADFLNVALPLAIENAAKEEIAFREGMPVNYLSYLGKANTEKSEKLRQEFVTKFSELFEKLQDHVDLDAVADDMGSEFVVSRLKPTLPDEDFGRRPSTLVESHMDLPKSNLCIRWRDPSWLRLVLDVDPESGESQVILNHCMKNELGKHMSGEEQDLDKVGSLRFEEMFFFPLRELFKSRKFQRLSGLQGPDLCDQDRLALADILYDEGLIETKMIKKKDEN